MMRRLFGTDGIRGVANVEPMTSETALKLGRAAGHVFKTRPGRHRAWTFYWSDPCRHPLSRF